MLSPQGGSGVVYEVHYTAQHSQSAISQRINDLSNRLTELSKTIGSTSITCIGVFICSSGFFFLPCIISLICFSARQHTHHSAAQSLLYAKARASSQAILSFMCRPQTGKCRYDLKQSGFGGQTKPVFHTRFEQAWWMICMCAMLQ